MKPTALGPRLGLSTFWLVAATFAQAPSGAPRPGKPFSAHPTGSAHPAGSAGRDHRPFNAAAPLGSSAPAASGASAPRHSPGMQKRLMELLTTHKARREAHVSALRGRFSELHLRSEALRNELRRHARSMAFLARARLLTEEEVAEPKRAKVLKRIEVLLAKEQARHDRHVARLTSAGALPSGSAPPFASGFVPPGAPSGMPPQAGSGMPKRRPPPAPAPVASAGGAK